MSNDDKPDKIVLACNYHDGTSACAKGALCYVRNNNPGGGADKIELLARSRCGRWITHWEPIYRLCNFRFKTVVSRCPQYHYAGFAECAELGAHLADEREAVAAAYNNKAERVRAEREAKSHV